MIRFVDQLDLAGKRVLARADLDVPLDASGGLEDDHRIRAALPTLRCVLDAGGRLIVASHLSRPDGRGEKSSLEPAAARLAELLDKEVRLSDDCVGDGVKKLVLDMRAGDVVMLENLRFHREEAANSPDFARSLAGLCDAYVDDAFGSAHLSLASTVGIVAHLAGPKAAGLLMKKELDFLGRLLKDPPRPFVAILGGADVAEKLKLFESLLPRVDALLVGGSLSLVFLAAQGVLVGQAKLEEPRVQAARRALEKAERLGVKVLLPSDHVCAESMDEGAKRVVVGESAVPDRLIGLDIGPRTAAAFAVEIRRAQTAFWSGPMGVCEVDRYAEGSRAVAQALCEVKGTAIVGGGDSALCMHRFGLAAKVAHVSTGGAACLKLIEGAELAGVRALESSE